MLYREAGQFKSTYAEDNRILTIRQDRIGFALILLAAFVLVPALATPYFFSGILIPFLIFSLAAIGLNILTGYAGQVSLGTERYLTWSEPASGSVAADEARAEGFRVVGIELADGAVPLHELGLAPGADVCLALGNEDHGLPPATLAACDDVAYLPQLGRVGSLNVAAAAAIALYEVRRRAWAAQPAQPADGPAGEAGM